MKLLLDLIKNYLQRLRWAPLYFRYTLGGHDKKYFKIFTHLTKPEKLLLYQLACSLPKNSVIVEIGSYLGASSSFLASGAKKNNSKVYCVDTWHNEGMTEGQKDTFTEFKENVKAFSNIIPLRNKSADAGQDFSEKIDLIFVDGDHSYQSVKTDLQTWLPYTKKGAVIIMHD